VLHNVDYETGKNMVAGGEAIWLDVRLESEHKNVAIPGSMNIPLYLLRIKSRALDHNTKYIVYCDTGRRSSSAAYLLSERGFNALYLDGGLRGLKKEQSPSQ
jgi:rhodanese-related sulfurtransferase